MYTKDRLASLFATDALRYEHLHVVNPVAEKLAVDQRRALRRLRAEQEYERVTNGSRLTERWHDYERAGDVLGEHIAALEAQALPWFLREAAAYFTEECRDDLKADRFAYHTALWSAEADAEHGRLAWSIADAEPGEWLDLSDEPS